MLEDIRDNPDRAQRIFDRLVEMFAEHNINPSPLNYYVWYEYIKGNIPAFRQEMDSILNDPFGYTDRVGKRLYDEYLKEDESPATEFDRAFRRLIDIMVKKMNAWTDRLDNHTQELDRCSTELSDPNIDAQRVKSITDTVLNAANTMKESSEAFQKEFIASSEEVKELRQKLIEAQSEAMQDELTQIGNRKMFNTSLAESMVKFQSDPENLCLIITDLDYFKKFNDKYGHLVGDSILRFFANIMKKHATEDEIICRYGGEEFAIILNNSSLEKAAEKANDIRIALEKTLLKRKDQNKPISTVTASFGVARYNAQDSAEDFIQRADKALYQAKENGRNQVVTEDELKEA